MTENKLVTYHPTPNVSIELPLDTELRTVWLTQKQIAQLLNINVRTVNEHIQNFKEHRGEAANRSIRKFRILAEDGKMREIEHYNLTIVTYVGFRAQATESVIAFQDWVGQKLDDVVAPKPMSGGEMLVYQGQLLIEMERQIAQLQDHVTEHDHQIGDAFLLVDKINERLDRADFYTVAAWCKKQGLNMPYTVISKWAKAAAAMSRAKGVEIIQVPTPNEQYDHVNGYHKSILLLVCNATDKTSDQPRLLD